MAQTLWVNEGSYLRSPKLSAQMREQAAPFYVWRQFVNIKEALGKNAGDTVEFTKRLRIDTRGGTLTETATMPANRIKFVKDSVTVNEYGNGVNYTQKIETLSEFNIRNQMEKGLVDDQKDTIDNAIATQFKLAKFKAVCTATTKTGVVFTTNGTATATASNNPSDKNIRAVIDYLKKKQVPKIGTHYVGILSVDAMSGLYDYLQAIAQYAEPEFRFKDEIGRYYGCRFVEDNNILDNSAGASSYGEGVIFGEEAVLEAVALPEELRYEETDLGRSKKLGWYAILGFKKIWDLTNDDKNSTGKGIERIVHITSA